MEKFNDDVLHDEVKKYNKHFVRILCFTRGEFNRRISRIARNLKNKKSKIESITGRNCCD